VEVESSRVTQGGKYWGQPEREEKFIELGGKKRSREQMKRRISLKSWKDPIRYNNNY